MTSIAKESGRLAWLQAALSEQRMGVANLLRRLTTFGSGNLKPTVLKKFLATLEQISVEKDRETEILSRINAMEAHHLSQRRGKKLRPAPDGTALKTLKALPVEADMECERSHTNWLSLMGLVLVMSGKGPKPPD